MGPIPQPLIDKFFSVPRDFRFAAERIIGKTINNPEDFEGLEISDEDFVRLVTLFAPRPPNKFKVKTVKIPKEKGEPDPRWWRNKKKKKRK